MSKSKLRDSARERECTVRVPGYCNFNPETSVLAHLPIKGMHGTALKTSDLFGAFACSTCHAILDGQHPIKDFSRDELKIMHFEGMIRTQAIWAAEGLVILPD